jgi:hypothetical protein
MVRSKVLSISRSRLSACEDTRYHPRHGYLLLATGGVIAYNGLPSSEKPQIPNIGINHSNPLEQFSSQGLFSDSSKKSFTYSELNKIDFSNPEIMKEPGAKTWKLIRDYLNIRPELFAEDPKIILTPFLNEFNLDLSEHKDLSSVDKGQLAREFFNYQQSFTENKIHPPLTFSMPRGSSNVFMNENIFARINEFSGAELLATQSREFNSNYGKAGEPLSRELIADLTKADNLFSSGQKYAAMRRSNDPVNGPVVTQIFGEN